MLSECKAKVVHSTIEIQWIARTIIPELPFPNTEAFRMLIRKLEPHNPEANRIFVETPSNKLSDVEVRFGFRNGDIQLSFNHTSFRLAAAPFENAYREELGKLAICAASQPGSRDSLFPSGKYVVQYMCHLELEGRVAADFFSQIVNSPSDLNPEGCSFRSNLRILPACTKAE